MIVWINIIYFELEAVFRWESVWCLAVTMCHEIIFIRCYICCSFIVSAIFEINKGAYIVSFAVLSLFCFCLLKSCLLILKQFGNFPHTTSQNLILKLLVVTLEMLSFFICKQVSILFNLNKREMVSIGARLLRSAGSATKALPRLEWSWDRMMIEYANERF